MPAAPRMRFEQFRDDYESLSALMLRSWAENRQQAIRYTPELLRSMFTQPGCTPDLLPSLYSRGELAAFIAGIPRVARHGDRRLRILVSALLTVRTDYKKSGVGALIWGELAERARAAGFDGMLSYCVEGDDMNRMIAGIARLFNHPTHQVFSVRYLACTIRPTTKSTVRECDPEVLLRAAETPPRENALVREWTTGEAAWQQSGREASVCAAYSAGNETGVLTGYIVDTLADPPLRCVIIDDILWSGLRPENRMSLLRSFLDKALGQGAKIALAPVAGSAPDEAMVQCGFRRTPRMVHVYYSDFKGTGPEQLLDTFAMDVF